MACPSQPLNNELARGAEQRELAITQNSTLTSTDEKSEVLGDSESTKELPVRNWTESDDGIEYPEGGLRAWLVVVGATASTFSTFGYVNAWGVFQAFYEQELLKNVSSSTIAWIGSTQYALTFAVGVIMGRLFDIGIFHTPLIFASILMVVINLVIGQCTKFWQLFICQGIFVGLASGTIFGPTLAVISHWFKKRRGIATGIMVAGASVGGAIYPVMVKNLTHKVGFPWTMRIIALLLLFTTSCINLFLRRRLPPVRTRGGFLNWRAFKFLPFAVYTVATFMCFLGFYTVLTYIEILASKAGIAPSFDVYFLVISNGVSSIGRVLSGVLADRFGAVSVMIPSLLVTAAVTYAWPFSNTFGSLLTIAILNGLSSAAFAGLNAVPPIYMGEMADVGRRTGTLFTIVSFAVLAGPPISGAIQEKKGLPEVGYYAGSCILLSAALMYCVRRMMTGKWIGGKF